jgi:hypothetical protein
MAGKRVEITVKPGTNPAPDSTELKTLYYTATDKVYFENGDLKTLPGWVSVSLSGCDIIRGAARSINSYRSTIDRYLIGTNTNLYVFQNGENYNITPLQTSTTAIANSIATDYQTLANNPLATTNGSKNVVVTLTAHRLEAGDRVTISGAATTNGIPNTELNATHIVRETTANTFTIAVPTTAATSTGSGGGASVVSRSAVLRITAVAHGLSECDRVKITGAASTGGVPDTEINAEHLIRYIDVDTFDIVVSTAATSAVTGGGGAATVYQKPIAAGEIDFSLGLGYGGGLYGIGLYGVAKTFVNAFKYPRIWSGGQFGNDYILTPGGQTNVYIWENDTTEAPTILTNAPTTVNWVFVNSNIVVTLGSGGVGNRIKASDVGDATIWAISAASYAYEDDIEGAGTFISQASSRQTNLLFTENEVYTFTFVDKPDIWETRPLLRSDGLIAPKGRIEIEESIFWMGQADFWMFNGANIQRIPNNTCREYIYDNLNSSAVWKSFVTHDPIRSQIIFYFPLNDQDEPYSYAIYKYDEQHWTLGEMERTAGEEKILDVDSRYMVNGYSTTIDGVLYRHDVGSDDDGSAMTAYAETNYAMIGEGDSTMEIMEIIPDTTQTGDIAFAIYTKDYAQSTEEFTYGPYTITNTTKFIDPQASGRQRKYRIEKNTLGANFSIGKWFEIIQQGPPL